MYLLLFTLLLASNACDITSADQYVNELLDQVLNEIKVKIIQENRDTISIPDVKYEWTNRVGFITLYGKVSCEKGKLSALSTIQRTGDAEVNVFWNSTIEGAAPIGLKVLIFSYDSCYVGIKDIFAYKTSLNGNVGKNSIKITVDATAEDKYVNAKIRQVELQELSDIKITTGSDILNKLADKVINKLIGNFNLLIFEKVRTELKAFEGKEFHITAKSLATRFNSEMKLLAANVP